MNPTMDELEALLDRLGRQRFVIHQFHVDQHGPEIVAAVHDWGEVADVVILFDESIACAYRTPTDADVDVFDPRAVFWWYSSTPYWTLRELLKLPQPAHPEAPSTLVAPPPGYALPKAARLPVRIRMRQP